MIRRRFLFIVVIFSAVCVTYGQGSGHIVIDLNQNWSVHTGSDSVYTASVPGSVHLDLLNAGVIEDPFFRDNETKCQWVEENDWVYNSSFEVDSGVYEMERIELLFKGLDTYASVFLNDRKILEANNMFRQWSVDVRPFIKIKNRLRIEFRSVIKENSADVENASVKLPAPSDASDVQVSPYVRKAPYQFGWDLGPRLVGCGIWAPIELHAFNGSILRSVDVETDIVGEDSIEIRAKINIDTQFEEVLWLRTVVGNVRDSMRILFDPGERIITLPIKIEKPELWRPTGYGEQHLYDLTVELEGIENISSCTKRFGVRSVKLLQDIDSIGQEFAFQINGQKIFMKGANMVPLSMYPSEVTRQQTEYMLDQVLAANMNMIRVWGGGIYGSDDLYELCDEKGIMVWQDFMFASSAYPYSEGFQENVQEEVAQQVQRISEHPSLVLWCGNNEVEVAWKNWGWQEQYSISSADSTSTWNQNKELFEVMIPAVIKEQDPRTPYIHTSPLSNWGQAENFNFGNMHYWGVWHGEEPIERFTENVGRFMSEYGMQSYPNWPTIEAYSDSADRIFGSPIFDHHQKSYKGDRLILEMVIDRYGEPVNAKALVHLSQILQAEAMTMAIDAHRLNFPHCMGSTYWQLNDVWPGPSWSTIDYSGQWKAAHYRIRDAFKPNVVLCKIIGDELSIFVRNENIGAKAATILVKHHPFESGSARDLKYPIVLSDTSLQKMVELDVKEVFGQNAIHKEPVSIGLMVDGKLVDQTILIERNNKPSGEKKEVELKVRRSEGGWTLTLNTDQFVPWVIIEASTIGHFSSNYFHLLPGEEKVILFKNGPGSKESSVQFNAVSFEDLIK